MTNGNIKCPQYRINLAIPFGFDTEGAECIYIVNNVDSASSIIQVKHDLEKRDADLAAETVKVQTLSKEIEKKDKELQEKTLTINQLRIHEELVKVLKDIPAP